MTSLRLLLLAAGIGFGLWTAKKAWGGPRGPRRVSALGDSLTADGGYCRELEAHLAAGSLVECHGYVGQRVKVVASHLGAALLDEPTDLVVLAGVNDLPTRYNAQDVVEGLRGIYAAAKARGIRVVAVLLTPWAGHPHYDAEGTELVNAGIANSDVAAVVDTSELGDSEGRLLPQYAASKDGLHLNADGQALLGKLIAEQAFGG